MSYGHCYDLRNMNIESVTIEERKPNANNVLANLSPIDQYQIKLWLEKLSYTETLDKINTPRPEGLGLKVHYTSLRNYYMDHIQVEKLEEQQADTDQASDMAQLSGNVPYMTMVETCLQKRLFKLALNPDSPINEIERLTRLILRLETIRLKRDQLALARQQLEAKVSGKSGTPIRRPQRDPNPNDAELEALFNEIQSKTAPFPPQTKPQKPSNPPVNKEKQELSSFPKPQPAPTAINPTKPSSVVLNNPNLPFPSIKPVIKK